MLFWSALWALVALVTAVNAVYFSHPYFKNGVWMVTISGNPGSRPTPPYWEPGATPLGAPIPRCHQLLCGEILCH